MSSAFITLPRDTNQVRGLAQYVLDYLAGNYPGPSDAVFRRVEQFHTDSVACGLSALACQTNAPNLLREEALAYVAPQPQQGATCFGSTVRVWPEKAVVANCSAVREWDSNGTNFGYNPQHGNTRGEFGHNDFYPVVIAAAQQRPTSGRQALLAMILLDEIRGRLAEVFPLREYKIDHVVHGAIASALVYGAMLGASVDQLESAVGLVMAHYIPFRAIRHGKQLSDSKGASAALSTEMAVVSVHRALRGFVGPADIFRNVEAIFCLFERPEKPHTSPFDLTLAISGDDFAIMGMHFKIGLYEHQSAGAIQGLISLLQQHPQLLANPAGLQRVQITIYEPAFSIIGDPAKRDPRTRQSADHSMVYIIATLMRKAFAMQQASWHSLMLMPEDYSAESIVHPETRRWMSCIEFQHGGKKYDDLYPDGIPTSLSLKHATLGTLDSGLVMYPQGHARCETSPLAELLDTKFQRLASLAVANPSSLQARFQQLIDATPEEVANLYAVELLSSSTSIDAK